mgnify:CR=1 FL=1
MMRVLFVVAGLWHVSSSCCMLVFKCAIVPTSRI